MCRLAFHPPGQAFCNEAFERTINCCSGLSVYMLFDSERRWPLFRGSDARTLNGGGTSLTLNRCRRARRCLSSRNTFKNGKKNAIHIGGRAAFHNRCGLQYALFIFKRRKYSPHGPLSAPIRQFPSPVYKSPFYFLRK